MLYHMEASGGGRVGGRQVGDHLLNIFPSYGRVEGGRVVASRGSGKMGYQLTRCILERDHRRVMGGCRGEKGGRWPSLTCCNIRKRHVGEESAGSRGERWVIILKIGTHGRVKGRGA